MAAQISQYDWECNGTISFLPSAFATAIPNLVSSKIVRRAINATIQLTKRKCFSATFAIEGTTLTAWDCVTYPKVVGTVLNVQGAGHAVRATLVVIINGYMR